MDDDQREAARARLALLELMVAAQQRRHEVVDVIWSSRSEGEAEGRLRDLLGVQDGTPARLVLDMQMRRLTEDARSRLTQEIEDLRGLLA
jgi:DNA gyrase/topoisomerase IV subunit A